jgi:type VI secretion system secreted protein VgrG
MRDDFREADGQRLPAKLVTGRQVCKVTVPGTDSAAGLSVERFRVREAIGESYVIPITLTHPDALNRADYVGRDATVTIDYGDGHAPRNYSGYILHFSKLKTTHDFSSYKITVVSHLRRMDDGPSTRIFQRKSDPGIIESIMRARGFLGHQFDFRLRRKYPQHDFRFQYGISDWQYIRMLMEKSGIYSYTVEGEFGDVVVFGDDIDHYIYQPELKVLYREMSGMNSEQLAVSELKTHVCVVPQSFLVADYNPDKAWSVTRQTRISLRTTRRPAANRMCTARITSIRKARVGKRGCAMKRPSRGRSFMKARAIFSN